MFIIKMPSIAIPLRLSNKIILSCWPVGAASIVVGVFVISLVLVNEIMKSILKIKIVLPYLS
jgi:hypothetical protein